MYFRNQKIAKIIVEILSGVAGSVIAIVVFRMIQTM